jgi:hypothetical protein
MPEGSVALMMMWQMMCCSLHWWWCDTQWIRQPRVLYARRQRCTACCHTELSNFTALRHILNVCVCVCVYTWHMCVCIYTWHTQKSQTLLPCCIHSIWILERHCPRGFFFLRMLLVVSAIYIYFIYMYCCFYCINYIYYINSLYHDLYI